MITGKYPALRLRRNRKNSWIRRLVQENDLSHNDLILPIFLTGGKNKKIKINSSNLNFQNFFSELGIFVIEK